MVGLGEGTAVGYSEVMVGVGVKEVGGGVLVETDGAAVAITDGAGVGAGVGSADGHVLQVTGQLAIWPKSW